MPQLDPIGHQDIDRLAPLWGALHRHHQKVAPQLAPFVPDDTSWASRKRQYTELSSGEWFGFIARDGDRDIGYLLGGRRPMAWNATFSVPSSLWELVTLFVEEQYRGQGIGSRLLTAMDEFVARTDIRTKLIGVIPDNRSAVELYKARGYLPTWLMLTRFQRPAPTQRAERSVSIEVLHRAAVHALEPLWLSLHHHHQTVSPHLGPFVTDEVSWPVIRELLSQSAQDGLLLVALDGDQIVGLASAAIYGIEALASYSDTWTTGENVGEIKFLVVAEDARGKGVGAALMDTVDRELAARGVHDQFVGAMEPNKGAIRFYKSRGFRPAWLELTKF
jgi:ribosomal protein S18 acetylase RimI-like enzyme